MAFLMENLGNLVNSLMEHANQGNESALKILYYIVKIFYVSNQLQVLDQLQKESAMEPWIQFFKAIMEMEAPEHLKSFTEDMETIGERDSHIFWKIKAVAARYIYRLFYKYGRLDRLHNKDDHEFAKFVQTQYSEILLNANLKLLFDRKV